MEGLLEEAKRLISINSVTSEGNEAIANLLIDHMNELGFKTQIQHVSHSTDNVSKRQFNIIGTLGDPLVDSKSKKGLLLNTHLDTVSPGVLSNWSECDGNPFKAQIKDGRIYGLGSADVKLDFLCKMLAAAKFRDQKLKMPIYLVGTCGEELGMFGAKYLIQSKVLNPKYVVVGEPSELSLIYAHKSLNIFKTSIGFNTFPKDAKGYNRKIILKSTGRSAHGSYPSMGLNAILQLFEILQSSFEQGFELKLTEISGGDTVNKVPDQAQAVFYVSSHQLEDFKLYFEQLVKHFNLEQNLQLHLEGNEEHGIPFWPDEAYSLMSSIIQYYLKLAKQFQSITDLSYNPAHSTVNFGMCKQNGNTIELFFDLRILPDQNSDLISEEILSSLQQIAQQYPKMNIKSIRQRTNPGLGMTENHDLVRLAKDALIAAGIEVKLDKKATSTEAAQYFKAGYEAVVIGPGRSHGNSHSPNEYNELKQIDQAILFYEKLIERICT